jgi:lysophospholipase L1-like esterase
MIRHSRRAFLAAAAAAPAAHARTVPPARVIAVEDEMLHLSPDRPRDWRVGTRLRGLITRTITAPGALDPASVVVKKGGQVLVEGEDYVFDHEWGMFGVGPKARVTPADPVAVSYRYSLLRLDSVVRAPDGRESVRAGESHISTPHPPDLAAGETRVANIFVPYFSDGTNAEIFPIAEPPSQAPTRTARGRIPKTLRKLQAGERVTIVAWGDSVTVGGDASSSDTRYAAVFERMLRQKFPPARIDVEVVAAGGSHSRQWLYPEKFPYAHTAPGNLGALRWDLIASRKPDLVTIEFVNDCGMPTAEMPAVYDDILSRLRAVAAEVILITPSFTALKLMKSRTVRDPDSRPYVRFVRELAEQRQLALADASARWEHLWKEGLPYLTLLNNAFNHPDDRGHRLFAEELMKCFEPEGRAGRRHGRPPDS